MGYLIKKSGRRLRSKQNGKSSQRRLKTMKGGINIKIKNSTVKPNADKKLTVDDKITVANLKEQIARQFDLSPVTIMLVVQRASQLGIKAVRELRGLNDTDTLIQSGIIEGSELEIIPQQSANTKDIHRAIWS